MVTGKTFGVTNIIALDADKNVIQDQRVIVEQDDRHTVVLYKGSLRHSYTCSPTCSPAIVVGDDQTVLRCSSIEVGAGQDQARSVPDRDPSTSPSERPKPHVARINVLLTETTQLQSK